MAAFDESCESVAEYAQEHADEAEITLVVPKVNL